MELRFQSGQSIQQSIQIEREGDDFLAVIDGRRYTVHVVRFGPGEITFEVSGQRHHAYLASDGPTTHVAFGSEVHSLTRADSRRRRAGTGSAHENLRASMHGQVTQVLVTEGQAVTRGQTLIVMEAMKMEIRLAAPHDGHVARILCSPGQIAERGQPLVELA